MNRAVCTILIFAASTALANEEISVELPGGAAMEFLWIEPGAFLMGAPDSDPRNESEEGILGAPAARSDDQ